MPEEYRLTREATDRGWMWRVDALVGGEWRVGIKRERVPVAALAAAMAWLASVGDEEAPK